ncbi:MAG: aspartate-semialdehyde dehydrogenase [Candidatus Cloacimonetes bacterium 4572_55]|nr:MAG: aspartate-semialdehyde dehydrogenase [Candidatus Cloacimonetes bacterium 4572_55]
MQENDKKLKKKPVIEKINGGKLPVVILGATGMVGQMFVHLLTNHPWFEIKALTGSPRSAGNRYGDVCRWRVSADIPSEIADMVVRKSTCIEVDKSLPQTGSSRIAFSGLDASVAGEIEDEFARSGYAVLTNARNHRMEPDVPLIIPEVNPDHLKLIPIQQKQRNQTGFIVANPNCLTIAMTLALAPLHRAFGVDQVIASTLQAVSGAGYPGCSALDMIGNAVPYIPNEEEKIAIEPRKILGEFEEDHIRLDPIKISASVNRAPIVDGHLINIFVRFRNAASISQLTRAFQEFRGLPQSLNLPTAPEMPIVYRPELDRPQPRRDLLIGRGMSVVVGRVRKSAVLDAKFVVLGHNTIRGAAGASILNAEILRQYFPLTLRREK